MFGFSLSILGYLQIQMWKIIRIQVWKNGIPSMFILTLMIHAWICKFPTTIVLSKPGLVSLKSKPVFKQIPCLEKLYQIHVWKKVDFHTISIQFPYIIQFWKFANFSSALGCSWVKAFLYICTIIMHM